MSSLRNLIQDEENGTCSEVTNAFKRQFLISGQCLWPRRYVIALMLFLLFLLKQWRVSNLSFLIMHVVVVEEELENDYSIGNWTYEDLDNFVFIDVVADLLVQFPLALVIFIYGSYKFIFVSTVATSILHILTPVAMQHHSTIFVVLSISQTVLGAPIYTAVMTTWKDWAPPLERTRLIMVSLCGIFIGYTAWPLFHHGYDFFTSYESFYFSGIAGLIWALLWYNIASETPESDPLISEQELLYLECSIPSDIHQERKLKDVPWKSILTSQPIIPLCIIYFKMSCSAQAISLGCTLYLFILHLEAENPLSLFIPLILVFIILLLSSAVLVDYLIKRYSGRTLFVRKSFLSGGFILQCFFLFGVLSPSQVTKTAFFLISYTMYAVSLPGFLTLVLDLSPRYVSIISGILYTFYGIGNLCVDYLIKNLIVLQVRSINWIFLFDGIFTLVSALLFAKWGDAEEQLWSLNFFSRTRSRNGRSYPNPDHQNDSNLAP